MLTDEEQRRQATRYFNDPSYQAIVTQFLRTALGEYPPAVKANAAFDWFLYGVAMVVHPSLTFKANVNPASYEILPDGRAHHLPPVRGLYLSSDQFVLLKQEESLPPPEFVGEVVGLEPWVRAWKEAEATLDAFIGAEWSPPRPQ